MEIISGAQWNDCDLFYIQHSVYIIYIGLRCPAIIKESNMYGIHLLNSEAVGDCDNKIWRKGNWRESACGTVKAYTASWTSKNMDKLWDGYGFPL